MEQKTESSTSGLENQLRGMILESVKTADGQANHNTNSQRGRGRGRGRARYQPFHEHEQQANPSPSPTFPRRGGPTDSRGRGYRQHGFQNAPHHRPGSMTVQGGPVQNNDGQPQRILQRPQDAPFRRRGQVNAAQPHQSRPQGAFQSRPHVNQQPRENPMAQIEHLERLAEKEIPPVEMSLAEFEEKEAFRAQLEDVLRKAFAEDYPQDGDIATISLVGFGSLASGFGMPGSDMDLAVVPGWKNPSQADQIGIDRDVPRLLEKAVLDAKMGGRLLTRTRVPILKVCQSPTELLYTALCEERKKWDELPEAEQYPTDAPPEPSPLPNPSVEIVAEKPADTPAQADSPAFGEDFPELGAGPKKQKKRAPSKPRTNAESMKADAPPTPAELSPSEPATETLANKQSQSQQQQQPRTEKTWMREKVLGPLDFPKEGVGIQCDINFENPLGIHNTHMLRCYSLTDPRVRLIVLFVKAWAKRRKINSSYSGTLNSYGWVLMVLHYLVNIAQPPVCPNLQHSIPQPKDLSPPEKFFKDPTVAGYTVRFWRNESEIMQAAQTGQLSQNRQSIGDLLRGFFQYYASLPQYGYGPRAPQFYWTNEVLSLRTLGGIRSKQDKGWVSAKTTITAEKKVTNRYLFAIEDPFELDHNVARTVTHRGIVAIRDEFRRAWRILAAIGKGMEPNEGGIFDEVVEAIPPPKEASKEEGKKMGMEDVGVKDGEDVSQELA
jgi:terminal uridylyltransferase